MKIIKYKKITVLKKWKKISKKYLLFFERWVIINEMKNKGEKKNVSIY